MINGALSRMFIISLKSQNIYLFHRKPTNNGIVLLSQYAETVSKQVSLAADGQDGNGLQLEKSRLNLSSCFHASSNTVVCQSLCELRLYRPLGVQRKCSEWIKLATTNFQDSLGQKTARSH